MGRADILVVDDTPANLRLLTQALQGEGYRVRAATSGERALLAVAARPPDLILLDVRLPDMDGYQVCGRIKASEATRDVPVIFISALSEAEARIDAFAAGAVDFVTRPLRAEELLARVRTHLALRMLTRDLQAANLALESRLADIEHANRRLEQEIAARRQAEEENRRLLEDERRRSQRLEALRAAMTAIAARLDLPNVERALVNRAAALLDASSAILYRCREDDGELEVAAGLGRFEAATGQPLALGEAPASQAVAGRQIIRAALLGADSDGGLLAPLLAGEHLVGLLGIAQREAGAAFSADDEQLLGLFAQQAAVALQNARLFSQTQHLAHTDALTGLYNRRYFFELATRELERARRTGESLAMIMLDLDHFKLINDHYGHGVGDEALRAVAGICRQRLRASDIVGRYGGEELVMLLPETGPEQAERVAERLREAIAELLIAAPAGAVRLTASLGVTAGVGLSLDALLAVADGALYAAKHAGRNQVMMTVAPDSVTPLASCG